MIPSALPSASRGCWELLLWPRTSHETPQDPHDPQPPAQLWALQEDGDLCKFCCSLLDVTIVVSGFNWSFFSDREEINPNQLYWCIYGFFSGVKWGVLCFREALETGKLVFIFEIQFISMSAYVTLANSAVLALQIQFFLFNTAALILFTAPGGKSGAGDGNEGGNESQSHPCCVAVLAASSQGQCRGDDQVPQRWLHQIPEVHPPWQHVWVQQADAEMWVMLQLKIWQSQPSSRTLG